MFPKNTVFVSTNRWTVYNSKRALSTISASLVHSRHIIPSEISPFSSPNFEKYHFLVRRYQFSCSDKDAKQLHLQIIKNGFACELFLSNTLINIHTRIGYLVSARKLFDEMPVRNSVTWACLISGYTQNNMPNEACIVFRDMISGGFLLVHYAIGSVLRACQTLKSRGFRFALQVHALISKTQDVFDEVACNGLISMYGNCVDTSADYACRVFDDIKFKTLVSWNAIISVYCQRGDTLSAFGLFSGMKYEGLGFNLRPNEYTFSSLISVTSSFTGCRSFLLDQLLGNVEKSGFLIDLYVGSALVSGFARSGQIDTAKKIFKLMSVRNVVSMHGLMVGLVGQKQGEEAAEVFMEMKDLIKLNSDSFVVLLSAFAEFSLLDEGRKKGREVHAHVIRTGLSDSQVAIGNSLINMYARCGSITDSCAIFELMTAKDDVTWNSMTSSLDQNGCFRDALEIFCRMRRSGLIPANFTLISALSSCAGLGWRVMGEQIHSEGVKLGLDTDVSVSNTLLALYAEIKCVEDCKKIFTLMPDQDQVSWNSIIGAFSGSVPLVSEGAEHFMEMMRNGRSPNKITFINILGAISSVSLLEFGQQVHGLTIKYRITDDTAIENAMLLCYGKCGHMDECEKIFSRMVERKDDGSWNSMISGYIHNDLLLKAMDLVWLMMQNGKRLDCFTFATVLSACASVATLDRGMEVHACGIRACLDSDVVVGSALVDMYAKCGRVDYASRVFRLMPVRNVYSWNSMICGYARHGQGEKSLVLFSKMKVEEISPDHVTFVGVLSACSHAGLVEQGFEHFNSMSNVYGLTPKMEHFSCMVDILGRAGELDKIEKFLNNMPVEPSILIWRTVLGACSRASGKKTNLGKRAGKMLLELEPQNAVNYVLLANMYALGGKWEDVEETRVSMSLASAKKEAGCSWVTMKDGVHVFVASDKSHPDKNAISKKLKELHCKMREMGYVPETKFALHDLDLENQEEILSYHSEKLAVAFVLTRKSELPIRIMKNLRVCGDCHTAFKYISTIVGRLIVLRDSNRFHHFVDGNCSCGDYW